MKTILAYKTRNGGYGFSDICNQHEFILLQDDLHAIDEKGNIWQVVDDLHEEENVAYITFEDGEYIFNYAEDGGAIQWMSRHYNNNVDWDKVEEELDDEDIFELMKESECEENAFKNYLIE